MAKRLVRARAKIATAHIPYAIPSDAELPDRLAAVLAVVYLIATEAHSPTGGDMVTRVDLEAEAVRLARLLVELMPDEPEVLSLLALLLFTSARTPARTDPAGNPITLADQDRNLWNRAAIVEGSAWLSTPSPGRAARPALRTPSPSVRSPLDRPELAGDRLGPDRRPLRLARVDHLQPGGRAQPSRRPHRARRPEAGLAALEAIHGLERSHLWHAALADNLRRLGRTNDAARRLRTAVTLAPTETEQRLLQARLSAVMPDPA